MSKTQRELSEQYAHKARELAEKHRERDEEAYQEFLASGMTEEDAREAVGNIYYGGDLVDLAEPPWSE